MNWPDTIAEPPAEFLARLGTIVATFGEPAQDSGNVSYGLAVGGQRYFIKTAGDPADTRWLLLHPARVELLRNAVRLSGSCDHPALARLLHVIESPHGPMLVYEWVEGEHLGRRSPAHARFLALPPAEILAALDTIYDLHAALAARGWIAMDLYDGCLLYNFATRTLRVIDLDMYRSGPFINDMGRMFGSGRFMAPEEFERGATIDQRTNVFTLARAAAVFLGHGALDPATFRGPAALLPVLHRATATGPASRHQTVREFCSAWREALNSPPADRAARIASAKQGAIHAKPPPRR